MAPPVLLVHGLATSSVRTWGETGWLDLLADAGRVTIPVDLPGHGTAEKPHDPAAFADLEQQILARFPEHPVDAIGFSLGARLLLTIAAADNSHRFNRLVVAGVGRNLFEADEVRGRAIAAAIAGEEDPEDSEARHFHALADAADVDRLSLAALLRSPRPVLTPDDMSAVTCPVLVVLGDQDFAGPPDPLVDCLPDAELAVLRGVDHFATPKSFDFIDATLKFLGASPF